MVELTIDGIKIRIEQGTTVLEAAREMGIIIPTLCYDPGLTPYGACRLCIIEEINGSKSELNASCVMPVKQGMVIQTNSAKVKKARKLIMELLLASCPNSKKLQDMAANMGINKVRFKIKDKGCILCGLCVRFCKEQMQSGGIGFAGRGTQRKVGTAFNITPAECRNCGGCEWICPVCEQTCSVGNLVNGLCGGCQNRNPVETCLVCIHCSEAVGSGGHRVY